MVYFNIFVTLPKMTYHTHTYINRINAYRHILLQTNPSTYPSVITLNISGDTTSKTTNTDGVSVSTTIEQTTADPETTSKQRSTLPTTTIFTTTIQGKHYYNTHMRLNVFPFDVSDVNIYFPSYPNREKATYH